MSARGSLRIYLGAAPGVGKTFAMLNEGRRRRDRGTDVVVGFVETHGRARTAEQIADLETIPRRSIEYRGTTFEEMDVDQLLDRRPAVALVDELAHTNVPGCRNEKRWQDVDELLSAGIDVITTVNVQHLESLNDVVEEIAGVPQRETIPDDIVRRADQIELVDMTPEALRRRMAHGNIYAPEKVDAALTNYFRPGNLAALRELALLWVADRVDEALQEYRERHGISKQWETRERVMVALTGAPGGERLIRRAARMASRAHGELIGVHIASGDGLAGPSNELLDHHRALLREVGGRYVEVAGSDIATTLVDAARAEDATQLVLGASQRSRWIEFTRGSVINKVVRLSGPIDVHVISHESTDDERDLFRRARRSTSSIIPARRRWFGLAVAAVLPLLLVPVLKAVDDGVGLTSIFLLYLVVVIIAAAVGGTVPAVVAAVLGFLLVNWFFTPPVHTWTVSDPENVFALFVFLGVAGIVSWYMSAILRRSAEAARSRAEAETLIQVAAESVSDDPLNSLLTHLLEAFDLSGASIYVQLDDDWTLDSHVGPASEVPPDGADVAVDLDEGVVLTMTGPNMAAEERHLLRAFGSQLANAMRARRLHAEAAGATALAEANELRTALLAAVSHDLRTPLASIKAAASSLLAEDVEWSAEDERQFKETIDNEADRLDALVGNLLDMSRLTTGALAVIAKSVGMEEVVLGAVHSLGDRVRTDRVELDVPETLPMVEADPALLERAIANLVDNALTWSPPGHPVRVVGAAVGSLVEVRIIDQGPGIPPAERDRVFEPFQRLGDANTHNGVGLGLAVARGFVEAMRGELSIEDTAGGGITMVVSLPAADPSGTELSSPKGARDL